LGNLSRKEIDMAKKKAYILASTKYKRKSLASSLEKDRAYFERLVDTVDWKTIDKKDRIAIKQALGKPSVVESSSTIDTHRDKVTYARELINQGNTKQVVIEKIVDKYLVTDSIALSVTDAALAQEKQDFEIHKQQVIDLHVDRYEKIYQQRIDVDLSELRESNSLPSHVIDNMEIQHWLIAVEALQSKEKVLQMHTKKFKIELNNYIKFQETQKTQQKLHFSKLTLEQLLRLEFLLKKASDSLPQPKTYDESTIEEVPYQEVQEAPLEPSPLIKVIETKIEETPPPSTLIDIQRKLNEKLKQQLQKTLEDNKKHRDVK
jgi:hypothetical protein